MKIFQWGFIFTILTMYSYFQISGRSFFSIENAYAEAAQTSSLFNTNSYYVPINFELEKTGNPFKKFLYKLQAKARQEAGLCQINQQDYTRLSKQLSISFKTIKKDSSEVKLVYLPEHLTLTQKDLELQINKPNIHCMKLSIYQDFILLLTSHLS